MRAAVFDGAGGVGIEEVPDPEVRAGQVLIAVKAVGVNRADLLMREGKHAIKSPIGGFELAGEIVAGGTGRHQEADRVMALCRRGGGFAELAAVDERLVFRLPDGLSWPEGGALPIALVTAHDALVSAAALQPGESVLVVSATSGVGVVALQMARDLGAGLVMGSSRSASKLASLATIEPHVTIDTSVEGLAEAVLEATGGRGVDVILDMVGGPTAPEIVKAAANEARWVSIGRLGGHDVAFDLDELARKRLRLIGATFRTRGIDEYEVAVRLTEEYAYPALAERRVAAVVDSVHRLDAFAAVKERVLSDSAVGKVVIAL